jgi:ABC-type enterobactin transport system permease subunit
LIGEHQKGRKTMKRLLMAVVTLAVATAFAAPSFAAVTDAKTKAECEKADGVWIEATKKCGAKKPQ